MARLTAFLLLILTLACSASSGATGIASDVIVSTPRAGAGLGQRPTAAVPPMVSAAGPGGGFVLPPAWRGRPGVGWARSDGRANPTRDPAALPAGANAVPARALRAYEMAAAHIGRSRPSCHLSWPVLAGMGRVASAHARGHLIDPDGRLRVPIVGPALDGHAGRAWVTDTDLGVLDHDRHWDHALGPFQFLPRTWRVASRDGNGDGRRDPNNIDHAALAAGGYLCAVGGDLAVPGRLWVALLAVNPSADYARAVLAWAAGYRVSGAMPTVPMVTQAPAFGPAMAVDPAPGVPGRCREASVRVGRLRGVLVGSDPIADNSGGYGSLDVLARMIGTGAQDQRFRIGAALTDGAGRTVAVSLTTVTVPAGAAGTVARLARLRGGDISGAGAGGPATLDLWVARAGFACPARPLMGATLMLDASLFAPAAGADPATDVPTPPAAAAALGVPDVDPTGPSAIGTPSTSALPSGRAQSAGDPVDAPSPWARDLLPDGAGLSLFAAVVEPPVPAGIARPGSGAARGEIQAAAVLAPMRN